MKLKDRIARIPRPVRACLCAATAIVLAVVFYMTLGCPLLTFRQEFRRAEKIHLVGPSTIVDRISDKEYWEYDDMIVGETENGVCFFGRSSNYRSNIFEKLEYRYDFIYREKTGDITVLAAPNVTGSFWDGNGISLPLYIFTEYPDADKAYVTMTVSGQYSTTVEEEKVTQTYKCTFSSYATAVSSGVFRCFLEPYNTDSAHALHFLSDLCNDKPFLVKGAESTTIPCTVKLYDAGGKLIVEKELSITAASNTDYLDVETE